MAGGNIPSNLAPIFQHVGQKYGIDPAVLAGVASVESSLGQDRSTSSAGAVGLMQFLPSTAAGYHINPYNDAQAIDGAARYLISAGYRQNPLRAIGAYNGGPGNPQYGYARQVMSEANRLRGQLKGVRGVLAAPSAGSQATSAGFTVTVPQSVQKFDQAAYDQQHQRFVLGQFLKGQGKSAWDIGPKLKGFGGSSNPLFSSGLLPTTAPNPQDFVTTTTQLQKLAGSVPLSSHPASFGRGGYVNPIPGANLGRTDMGVDANLPAGHPIRAIGDSRVVNIYPNWYRGQPYMLLQLTSGPQAGKYYYVAEAINPTVHPGQRVGAGQMIGTYNPNGTGLELGWGTSSSRTLAQATTGYHEGQVTPAGQSFRQFLTRLH